VTGSPRRVFHFHSHRVRWTLLFLHMNIVSFDNRKEDSLRGNKLASSRAIARVVANVNSESSTLQAPSDAAETREEGWQSTWLP
jgi:hypothetical protein